MVRLIGKGLGGRWWAATVILIVAAAVVLAVAAGRADSDNRDAGDAETATASASATPSSVSGPASAEPGALAPATPPAQVCKSAKLEGPSKPPANAVNVSAGENLGDVVKAHPAKTTYWLERGIHRLGEGPFSQVFPHSGDTFIGAPGAVLDGKNENRYAFSGHAPDVTISFLTVQNFGSAGQTNNEGVVNHDSAEGWTVESSTIQKNAGAGVMLGSKSRLIGNCLQNNGQYGFNAYHPDGVRHVLLRGNEISGNNTDNWEKRNPGCGCTGGGKFWATNGARIIGNYVHDNKGAGLWADSNNVGFRFEDNYISDNDAEGIMYETSYNAVILNNTLARNALVKGPKNTGFPSSAIYLSEAGSDSRVAGPYADAFRISGNVFIDNWSGIVAWENADRFAGSPANTSTGSGTLVNPEIASVTACGKKSKIKRKPYIDDCRWKTQNVVVEGNSFTTDASKIPSCTPSKGCGFNGLFSNYGTYPRWSPYKADLVEKNITFHQNNVWRNNTYAGTWHFVVEEMGKVVSWGAWRSAPYSQDDGSSMN
jgi:nitrous oxidase accessory protein NosD